MMVCSVWRVSAGPTYRPAEAVEFFRGEWEPVNHWVRTVGENPDPVPTDLPTLAHFDNEVIRLQTFCRQTADRWEWELFEDGFDPVDGSGDDGTTSGREAVSAPVARSGFPHPEWYLPTGTGHAAADVWPLAEGQLDDFRRCVRAADGKLALLGARLPPATPRWWVRRWADAVLIRIINGVETLADTRAVYLFARRLDREVPLDASQTAHRSCDAEFTFYDRPFERDDGTGGRRPLPLATSGHRREGRGHIAPQPFPRSPQGYSENEGGALSKSRARSGKATISRVAAGTLS